MEDRSILVSELKKQLGSDFINDILKKDVLLNLKANDLELYFSIYEKTIQDLEGGQEQIETDELFLKNTIEITKKEIIAYLKDERDSFPSIILKFLFLLPENIGSLRSALTFLRDDCLRYCNTKEKLREVLLHFHFLK